MTILKRVTPADFYMGRLERGCDLWDEIANFCIKENISLGRIEAIGAVQKARIGFYNQESLEYQFLDLNQMLEITCLKGNVSVKDGEPMIHAHITLSDEKGNCYGGHLSPGTAVFVCELLIQAFDGPLLERGYDEETGLPLWNMED
ncbi:PPC domain-containing DNA-binding protein [Thermodesulfobacteriota bacterium]